MAEPEIGKKTVQKQRADEAAQAILDSVPDTNYQQVMEAANQAFAGAMNMGDVRDIAPNLAQMRENSMRRGILDAQEGSEYRAGVTNTTGSYTIDYFLSKLPDVFGGDNDENSLKDPDRAYFGKTGTYFLDSLLTPSIDAHPHLFQLGGASRYRPVPVKDEEGNIVRVVNMPHRKKVLAQNFTDGKESLTQDEYELLAAEVKSLWLEK